MIRFASRSSVLPRETVAAALMECALFAHLTERDVNTGLDAMVRYDETERPPLETRASDAPGYFKRYVVEYHLVKYCGALCVLCKSVTKPAANVWGPDSLSHHLTDRLICWAADRDYPRYYAYCPACGKTMRRGRMIEVGGGMAPRMDEASHDAALCDLFTSPTFRRRLEANAARPLRINPRHVGKDIFI